MQIVGTGNIKYFMHSSRIIPLKIPDVLKGDGVYAMGDRLEEIRGEDGAGFRGDL